MRAAGKNAPSSLRRQRTGHLSPGWVFWLNSLLIALWTVLHHCLVPQTFSSDASLPGGSHVHVIALSSASQHPFLPEASSLFRWGKPNFINCHLQRLMLRLNSWADKQSLAQQVWRNYFSTAGWSGLDMVPILPFYFSSCRLGWFVGFCFTDFCRKRFAQVLVSSYRIESTKE